MRITVSVLIFLLVIQNAYAAANDAPQPRVVTAQDSKALVDAIEDEIYDYGYYHEFWAFETAGPSGPEARFNIYVKPSLAISTNGLEGVVIYKYLPFGEVIRPFIISAKGEIYLTGKPTSGFPWTQPNTKTVYMNDEDICRFKHEWLKVEMQLDLSPRVNRLMLAAHRQKLRYGNSQRRSSKIIHK